MPADDEEAKYRVRTALGRSFLIVVAGRRCRAKDAREGANSAEAADVEDEEEWWRAAGEQARSYRLS